MDRQLEGANGTGSSHAHNYSAISHLEFQTAERRRLLNAVAQLERSNRELREANEQLEQDDSDFVQAIQENVTILQQMRDKVMQL
eukprot:scaffold1033_cov408-Prasinococcus_capsulatus_cf.AAC.37